MELQITEAESVNVLSAGDLRDHLARIRGCASGERPTIVTVAVVHGHTLTIGIHPEHGWVQVAPASGDPPYLVTVGHQSGDGVRAYYLHGSHHTEIPLRHELPIADAVEAAAAFVDTGELPERVGWVEV